MMEITLTCESCGSGIDIHPSKKASLAKCKVCAFEVPLTFDGVREDQDLSSCPCCERKDFYKQKDFNRKIGVALFIVASILAIFTYGISLIVLYGMDFILYRKIRDIVICYNCKAIFRGVRNIEGFSPFNHEMNDRIVYSGHDFEGSGLNH